MVVPVRIAVVSLLAQAACLVTTVGAQSRTVDQPSALRVGDSERSHWEISADTRVVAYEIRSPRSPVAYARRRLVQQTGLEHVLFLDDERTWRLISHVELRLDQELGSVCLRGEDDCIRETDVGARRDYQLLVRTSQLDVPRGWVEIRGTPLSTQVRLGRVVVFDAAGFARLDGGTASFKPLSWLRARVYGGRRTLDSSFAASPGLEPQGSIRISLPEDLSEERVPWSLRPSSTWTIGGSVSAGDLRYLRVDAGAREVRDQTGVVARRVWVGAASQLADPIRLSGRAVWDPTDGTVVDALASAEVQLGRFSTRARLERHVPRFDLGSIWAWFDVLPVDRAELGVSWRTERVQLGGAVRARRTLDDQLEDQSRESDFGGEAWVSFRRRGWRTAVRAWMWGGDFAPVAALTLDASRVLTWAEIYGRGSVWHFDHPFQSVLHGTSLAAALGSRVTLTRQTRLQFELEWAHNRVVGHRLRALVALVLRAWR